MSTIIFTKALLNDAQTDSINSTRAIWQYGLTFDASYFGQNSYTPSGSAATHYRPFALTSTYNDLYIPHPGKFLAGGPTGLTKLNIYRGTKPEINNITSLSALESDLLISFPVSGYSTSRGLTGLYVLPPATDYDGFKAICGICTALTTARSSGLATWFWFGISLTDTEAKVYNQAYTGNYNDLTGYMFVTGTVGTLGSGNDLEIASPVIEQNAQYKSFGFNFHVPAINTILE